MTKYIIGYIDEQEGERSDFANLITEDDSLDIKLFDVNRDTVFEKLIDEILESNIDCLVVDYHLSDAGVQFEGSNIIEEIHKIRPFFPKIIYTAKEDKVIPVVENEIIYMINDKSIKGDSDRCKNFRQKIKTLINNYNTDVSKSLESLETLKDKKRNGATLTIEEESELFKCKKFLMSVDTRIISNPEILNEKEYVEELRETNNKLDEILLKIRNS